MKKRLDSQQIHEVCLVFDRFIQALEGPIEVSHPDCSETFRQGSNVLPPRQLMESVDILFGPRQAAFLAMSCRKQGRYPAEKQTTRDSLSPHRNAAAENAGALHRIALQDSRDPVRKTVADALRLMDSLLLRNEDMPSARSRWPTAGSSSVERRSPDSAALMFPWHNMAIARNMCAGA